MNGYICEQCDHAAKLKPPGPRGHGSGRGLPEGWSSVRMRLKADNAEHEALHIYLCPECTSKFLSGDWRRDADSRP